MMFHMKTATIRDLRHDFSRVAKWIDDGEKVAITRRGHEFAVLAPAKSLKLKKSLKIPDFTGQMRGIFGKRMLNSKESAEIREAMRGGR